MKDKNNNLCFNGNCFEVEVAQTAEERNRGLMFREKIEQDHGMLFIFEREGAYKFWMKDTLISLDIIWMNAKKEIVYIQENAKPCETESCEVFGSEIPAKYVLEINSGISEQIELRVGDRADF